MVEVEHPACGTLKLLNSPVKYSRTQPTIQTSPPLLGQHTNEILKNRIGFDEDKIEHLRATGVVS